MGARRPDRAGGGQRGNEEASNYARAERSHARAEHGDSAQRSPIPPQSGDRGYQGGRSDDRGYGLRDRIHWTLAAIALLLGGAAVYWFSTPRDELVAPVFTATDTAGSPLARGEPPFALPGDWAQWQTHEQFLQGMTRIADQLATRYPGDPMACDLQGRVYVYLGRSAEAQQAWERCLQIDARRPDACLGLAKLAIKRGDAGAAETYLKRAWDLDYTLPEVGLLLAEILTRNRQADQAIALLERYVGGVPKSFEGWLQLGQVYLQQGDFPAAQRCFQQAADLRPTSSESLVGLGNALLRQGKRDEGRRVLAQSQTLRDEPMSKADGMSAEVFDLARTRVNCAGALLYAAQICVSHQDLREGEQLGRMSIGLDAKNLPARLFLISLCEQMGEKDAAIAACRETVAADPENPDLLWRLGVMQSQVGEFAAAADAFRKLIQCAPDQARGYGCLAEVYLETGQDINEALSLARDSVRLEPAALHYVLLGRVYAKLGQFTEARSALDEALRLEPDNAEMRAYRNQLPNGPR